MRPHVSGTERKGFSKARRSCNLVVAAIQAHFLLSVPCGRRLLCTSFERNMTHTFLSHKNPRADTFLRQPSYAVQPKQESTEDLQLVKKKVDCRLSYDSFLAHTTLQGNSAAFLATKTLQWDLQPLQSSPIKVLLSLRKVVCFRNFLRVWLPRRLSLVGDDIQTRRVSQNPNTREPKKEISQLRTHGTFPLRSHLLAFLGLFLFLNHLKVPFLWKQTTFLGLLLSFLTSPLFLATDQPWRNSTASTYVSLYVARWKKNPWLFSLQRLVGLKKNSTANLVVSSTVLDFSLSCVSRLVGKKFFDGEFSQYLYD